MRRNLEIQFQNLNSSWLIPQWTEKFALLATQVSALSTLLKICVSEDFRLTNQLQKKKKKVPNQNPKSLLLSPPPLFAIHYATCNE